MQKNAIGWLRAAGQTALHQKLLVMKLISIFLFAFVFGASATGVSQSVTLNGRNLSLQNVLHEVRKQTGYHVFGDKAMIQNAGDVSVAVRNMPLGAFLDLVFAGKGIGYRIDGNDIILSRQEPLKGAAAAGELQLAMTPPELHGRVIGPDGQPLNGATVSVKGSKAATITNKDGNFSLRAAAGDVLVVSFIGYKAKEVSIADGIIVEPLIITLAAADSKLDEIQVTAYGTTSRRLSIGTITTVTEKEIKQQPVNNPLYALQGRVPGLVITPTTGLAGGPVKIQLRGNNSLAFTTSPLIVIDGLPVADEIYGLGGPEALRQLSTLNYINLNNIESIEVLKDADATSIYGSRGANGVVLITTKKGKAGAAQIDINVQHGLGDVEKRWHLLSTPEWLALRRDQYARGGVDFVNTFPFGNPDEKYNSAYDLFVYDTTRYTDWQKELIGRTARYTDAQATMSGGNNSIQFVLGGNYHEETTVLNTDNKDRKASVNVSLTGVTNNQKLRATITAGYLTDRNQLPKDDLTGYIRVMPPNSPAPFHPDGSLNFEINQLGIATFDGNNPFKYTRLPFESRVENLMSSALISYQPAPFLTIKAQLGYNQTRGRGTQAYPIAAENPMTTGIRGGYNYLFSNARNLSFEPQIQFKHEVGGGMLDILTGASMQSRFLDNMQIAAGGYTSDALLPNLGAATTIGGSNFSSQYKYAGIFGRIGYNWQNKYLLNLNGRRDGSSRFGPGNRFGNFGSAGVAWIFTKENFLKNMVPALSFGKLRFSYGSAGNDGIPDYAYFERYRANIMRATGGYAGGSGLFSEGLFNPDYHWETTWKTELGFDLGMLDDKILLTVSHYRNKSGNLLVNLPLPTMTGPGSAYVNLPATIRNTGLELTLNTVNIRTRNFSWTTAINFTRSRNKLLSFEGLERSSYYSTLRIGQPFSGVERVYQSAGVDAATGKYQYIDVNGKIVSNPTDPNRLDNGKYATVYTDPSFFGGISNTFSFKRWSLDVLFQYSKKKGKNPMLAFMQSSYPTIAFTTWLGNMPTEIAQGLWKKPGDKATYPGIPAFGDFAFFEYGDWQSGSTAAWVDASFIKLKNFSLSYSFPELLKGKLGMKGARVYLQGQNLFTFTSYKGLDAETQSVYNMPPMRIVTFGMQLTF